MTTRDFLAGHRLGAGRPIHRRAMIAPARVAAYEVLSAVSRRTRRSADARSRGRAPSLDDERDRALAAEIATGVQRWRAALDHLIVAFAKRPIRAPRS